MQVPARRSYQAAAKLPLRFSLRLKACGRPEERPKIRTARRHRFHPEMLERNSEQSCNRVRSALPLPPGCRVQTPAAGIRQNSGLRFGLAGRAADIAKTTFMTPSRHGGPGLFDHLVGAGEHADHSGRPAFRRPSYRKVSRIVAALSECFIGAGVAASIWVSPPGNWRSFSSPGNGARRMKTYREIKAELERLEAFDLKPGD